MWFRTKSPEEPLRKPAPSVASPQNADTSPATLSVGTAAGTPSTGVRSKFFLWIYGISGQGKTLYLLELFRARAAGGGLCVLVDPNGVNESAGRVVRSLAELRDAIRAGSRKLVYQPGWGESVPWRALYDYGSCLVAVDEVQNYGAADSLDREFLRLVQTGRNRNVDIATTCQAPPELHPKIRQNFDAVVSFRQGIPSYAHTMAGVYFRSPALAEVLLNLPQFHYLRVSADGRVTRNRVRVPA